MAVAEVAEAAHLVAIGPVVKRGRSVDGVSELKMLGMASAQVQHGDLGSQGQSNLAVIENNVFMLTWSGIGALYVYATMPPDIMPDLLRYPCDTGLAFVDAILQHLAYLFASRHISALVLERGRACLVRHSLAHFRMLVESGRRGCYGDGYRCGRDGYLVRHRVGRGVNL